MGSSRLDRLAILTVSGSQSSALMKELSRLGFQFTIVNHVGGVVQESLACLLIGFSQGRLATLLEIVHATCETHRGYVPAQAFPPGGLVGLPMVEAQLGGALIYLMNVDRFEQF